jgi:L-lactate dehydrogenase complex protein LldG
MLTTAARSTTILEAFATQAERVGARVHRAPGDAAETTVVDVARRAGARTIAVAGALPRRAAIMEALQSAGITEIPSASLSPIRRADAGVSFARLGVAETGSLLLHSTSEDRRVELCVDVHLILVAAEALVATLDDAFATLREIATRPPAYAALLSGPSRSADIERQITIGVHGPRELHVVVLEATG